MSIYINVWSGLCNQLLPLISAHYLANKYKRKFYFNTKSLWICENECTGTKITDYFILEDTFIEMSDLIISKNCNIQLISKYGIYKNTLSNDELLSIENIFIESVCHLIGTENDSTKLYNPQPTKEIIKNDYFITMHNEFIKLKPINCILNKINETMDYLYTLSQYKIIGIHYRDRDGGFIENNKYMLEKFINNLISNSNSKIYLSCDSYDTEIYIKNIFKDKIITMINPFGSDIEKTNNSTNAILNSICEIYILSKLNNFFGTKSSSFTFVVWLLSKNYKLIFWN